MGKDLGSHIWAKTRPAGRAPGPRTAWLLLLLSISLLGFAGCTGRNLISWNTGWSGTAAQDGVVYVGTRDGEILALKANKTGSLRPGEQIIWRFTPEEDRDLRGVFGMPALGEKLVYVGVKGDSEGKGGKLYALSKDRESSGNIRPDRGEWKKDIEGAIVGGPAVAEAEGLVLVGSDDGNLYAFHTNGDTPGKMAWRFPTGARIWSAPVVRDGMVYFGSMDRHVYALRLEEGLSLASRLLWKYKTGGAVVAKPLLVDGPNGRMVIVGSFDKKLYALKADTSNPAGELAWAQPFKGSGWFWAGAVSDGSTIFAPSMDGTVYALDKRGFPVWLVPFKAESPIVSTPVVVGDNLVVATDKGKLHLLSASDGTKLEVSKDLESRVKAPLAQDGAMVFVGVQDKTVRGVDAEQWAEVWQISTKK